jgi:hypothetical protein
MTREIGSDEQLPPNARQVIADMLAAVKRRLDAEQARVVAEPRGRTTPRDGGAHTRLT